MPAGVLLIFPLHDDKMKLPARTEKSTRNYSAVPKVRKGRNTMNNKSRGMTNAQLNGYLELIAKLVEAKAATPEEAAKIIREAKVSEDAETDDSDQD